MPAVFPSYVIYSQKEFNWIKLVQGLNLNRRSISGVEPERPVTKNYSDTVFDTVSKIII